ncbi:MAG: YqgE/AlgH family protein [Proteobacteria bacterium]|nr:YqgE/AlgH family protein [Pseudomonadota bacterium]
MSTAPDSTGYLTGKLLLAMPQMQDPRFVKTVIYMCAHTSDGAMGLVVNRPVTNLSFPDLLEQLDIKEPSGKREIRIHFGGPVESSRGFVLHSADYVQPGTMVVNNDVALTATVEILREIARGGGPRDCLLVLGYAGWGPGQLDSEIQANAWLHVDADRDLVFGQDIDDKWEKAMRKLGIDPHLLSGNAGHA